jgi:ubiquinol-cytochrome c reductase core subunit 2
VLRNYREYFVDVLASFITGARLPRHELNELVLPLVEADSTAASNDPTTKALEAAHTIAFRHGLGASLFATQHPSFTIDDIKTFATSAFSSGNIAVLGTGIDQAKLSKLVEKSLGKIPSSSSVATPSTKYYGGETRVESTNPLQTVFIGFGTTGAPSSDLAALASHVAPEPHVKWSKGISPISEATPSGTTVQTVYLPYSDATLFGVLIQGENAADTKTAAQAVVKVLKSQVSETDAKKAVAKAKFRAASEADSRDGVVSLLGNKVFAGADASIETTLSSFDAVTPSSISSVSRLFGYMRVED